MKKTICALMAVVAVAGSAAAQGLVAASTTSATYSTYINSSIYNPALNGVYNTTGARTATAAQGYYYALLFQPYNAGLTAINPLDSNFAVAMSGTNSATTQGGIRSAGNTGGTAVNGWGAPTGADATTSERNNFLLVGWSSNLGTTWSAVSAQLQSGNWVADGYFGVSALGNAYAGGGAASVPVVSIFGVTGGAPGGLTQGITLYSVTVPEPGTMALAGLGGVALLLFRRRK